MQLLQAWKNSLATFLPRPALALLFQVAWALVRTWYWCLGALGIFFIAFCAEKIFNIYDPAPSFLVTVLALLIVLVIPFGFIPYIYFNLIVFFKAVVANKKYSWLMYGGLFLLTFVLCNAAIIGFLELDLRVPSSMMSVFNVFLRPAVYAYVVMVMMFLLDARNLLSGAWNAAKMVLFNYPAILIVFHLLKLLGSLIHQQVPPYHTLDLLYRFLPRFGRLQTKAILGMFVHSVVPLVGIMLFIVILAALYEKEMRKHAEQYR